MNADRRRLDRLREGQGAVGNHVIDEFAAGRLSRREFIRRGTVVGISLPVLGAIVSACGSNGSGGGTSPSTGSSGGAPAGKAGATIKAGIITPSSSVNPLTVADQGGLDMLGQTGEYLAFSDQHLRLQPVLAESWTSNHAADVWTFKIRQGVKFQDGADLDADAVKTNFERLKKINDLFPPNPGFDFNIFYRRRTN